MNRAFILSSLLLINPAVADESGIVLKDGPGKELVSANCAVCHSLDYIPMHASILDKQGWTKTVNKMIDVMGAPIPPKDTSAIVEYLAGHYGK